MHQRCVCPHCGTTLRVKDRGYLNRPIPCPDCRTLLVLKATNDDRLEATLADLPAETELNAAIPSRNSSDGPRNRWRFPEWMTNVTVVSWTAALMMAALVAGIAVWPRPRSSQPDVEIAAPQESAPEDVLLETDVVEEPPPSVAVEPNVIDAHEPPNDVAIVMPDEPDATAEDSIPADAAVAVAEQSVPAPLSPTPEPLREIDFDAALGQPLKSFRQDRAISRRELLDLLEELLGAPIRYDAQTLGAAAQPLDQKISFDLQDVTVGDLLAKVLEKTDLVVERERDGLRLRVKGPAEDARP